ncbi:MAG: phytoene/squalene synthase family protein, partial [Hyphomicrobiales bacterium]
MSIDAADYCRELVRTADRDRYLASLFAPDDTRPHLFALYAFNAEVARVREVVSEPMAGEMRLQWWRDAVESIYAGSIPDHPVAHGLAGAVEAGGFDRRGLINLIEARAFDLYDDPMPSLDTLEGYLGETSSSLIQMASLILAGADAVGAADAAGHAGVAYGMTGLMRSVPIHRARGQCFIPADVLEKYDLTPAHILSGTRNEAVRLALREMRQAARAHLTRARDHLGEVPGRAVPAFLPVSLVDLYLKRLGRHGSDALTKVVQVQQMRRQIRLLMAALWR